MNYIQYVERKNQYIGVRKKTVCFQKIKKNMLDNDNS